MLTKSPEETAEAGKALAATLAIGSVVCLYGGLGAGKTVFVKGMASALGLEPRDIISPSYTIIAEYGIAEKGIAEHGIAENDSHPPLYHVDLYRLERGADIESLGLYDYMEGKGITVIEWADRLPPEETAGAIKVHINLVTEDQREIIIDGPERL